MYKKTITTLIIALSLVSCIPKQNSDLTKEDLGEDLKIRVIDSCEYIENSVESSTRYSLTHKGNCKFCKQRNEH